LLRRFNAQLLLDSGADAADIDLPLGRSVEESILFELYIADYERCLRQVFERYAPRVFP
jgi:hypothetical protein